MYILGLGLGISEFDLLWLLRRKQREEKGTGKVNFYINDNEKAIRNRDLMLTALGVMINPKDFTRGINHSVFNTHAMDDIAERIVENHKNRS